MGDSLYVEGSIRYRSYDDAKGQRRYVTEVYAENMEMLSSRNVQEQEMHAQESSQNTTGKDIPF